MIGHVQLGSAAFAAVFLAIVSAPSQTGASKSTTDLPDAVNSQSPQDPASQPT